MPSGWPSRAMPRTYVPGMVLEGGTLTSWQAPGAAPLVQLLAAGTWDGSRTVCLGTLLGPEGPGARALDHSDLLPPASLCTLQRRRRGEEGRIDRRTAWATRYATHDDPRPPVP
jgi:hypothetical protein